MGVYIELYAPIFNYNSMSQVIKKFEPGGKTTQPRLYKRGNDDIDLDAYIRNAESEFSYWLANSRLKDKEKQQVQEAYSQILQGINDGTFTYKIGGGYNNSVGMSNKTKGFDAAGLAAGFLGNILRNQSVYKAPEEKPDPSKIEWKGNSSVGSALVRHLYGSDKESLKDFIDLDSYDTKTKKRGNANRIARFKSGLEYIRDNFDNLFTSFTDSDKATALEGINSALSAFNNGTVEDNEYLDLSRATGMSNLRDMFFSGETYGNTAQTTATPSTEGSSSGSTYNNEDEWRASTHPRSTVTNLTNRSLTTTAVYKREGRIKLNSILMNMPKDNLLKLIWTGINYSPTGQELNRGKSILKGFGQLTSFENNFIIRQALEAARRRKILHQFPTAPNSYYIPFVSSKLDSRSTGFVYTISPDGNHTLREMDRWDIPFYTTQWHNEFTAQVPSNRKGGILKFKGGGTPQWYAGLTDYDPTKYTFAYNVNNLVDGDMSDTSFDPWASATAGQQLGRYTPTTGHGEMGVNKAHFNFAKGVEGQQYYQNFGQALLNADGTPTDVGVAWMKKVDALLPEDSPARFYDANGNLRTSQSPTGRDAHGRAQKSYSSLADYISAVRNDQILGARHNVFLNEGKRYFYKAADGTEHWVDPEQVANYIVSENPVRSQWNDDKTVYWRDYELTGLKAPQEVTAGDDPQGEHSDAWNKVFGVGKDQVNEKFLPPVDLIPKTGSFGNFMAELTPDLIGAGRLVASLHTNNRVANTIRPSLKPVLYNPINLHKPLTGDFAAMQNQNRLAAEIQSNASRPFTSDASLAAARQLEGQRIANDTRLKGSMIDNEAIKKSNEDRFNLIKELMYYNDKMVYKPNKKSINQTDRERAQLGATRLKSDWQSQDNFSAGIETRRRTRLDENRERANNFYDKVEMDNATRLYNDYKSEAYTAAQEWLRSPEGKNADGSSKDITEWPQYTLYKRNLEEAERRAQSMMYSRMAQRYGFSYTNPWTEESNNLFFNRGWRGRYLS